MSGIRYILSLAFFIGLFEMAEGQDPQFSRFYSNSLYLAPSFTGVSGANRFSLSYRNQWPSIGNGFVTYTASYDRHFENLKSGIGVLFLKDQAGDGNLSTANISILYSYDVKLGNLLHFRPGMSFSYTERSIDFSKLIWMDQLSAGGTAPNSGEVPTFEKVADIDFAASGLFYTEMFWLGASVDHLLQPNQSLYYHEFEDENMAIIPIKMQVFGGYQYTLKERLLRPKPTRLQFAFLYKQQAEFQQIDFGFYWHYSPIVAGIWYRGIPVVRNNAMNDAVVLLLGIKTDKLNIGYSYDFTTSNLLTNSGGSHEISVSYTFEGREHKKNRHKRMIPCPEF